MSTTMKSIENPGDYLPKSTVNGYCIDSFMSPCQKNTNI